MDCITGRLLVIQHFLSLFSRLFIILSLFEVDSSLHLHRWWSDHVYALPGPYRTKEPWLLVSTLFIEYLIKLAKIFRFQYNFQFMTDWNLSTDGIARTTQSLGINWGQMTSTRWKYSCRHFGYLEISIFEFSYNL